MKASRVIILLAGILIALTTLTCKGQGGGLKHFDGFYGAVGVGSQNVFAGALIDGVDVLTHENELVVDFSIGYRKQVLNDRLVLGALAGLGVVNGQMSTEYNNGMQTLEVFYESNNQTFFGIDLGYCFGAKRNWLVSAYALRTSRKFDIEFVEESGYVHNQTDENIFLRYGIAIEKNLTKRVNLKASLGRVYVDHGGAVTTQDVMDANDYMIAIIYQL